MLSKLLTLLTYSIVVVALTFGILWLIPANDVIFMPGSAQPTCSLVHVSGETCKSTTGGLYDTYVTEFNANHLLYVAFALLRSDYTVSPAGNVSGSCPAGQYESQLLQMMADSKIEAEASALNAAGYKLQTQRWGPQIIEVNCGTPALSKLQSGDRILAIDGHRTNGLLPSGRRWPCVQDIGQGCSIFQQIHYYVSLHRPGSTVKMTILRGNKVRHVSVRTVAGNSSGQVIRGGKSSLIGIEMSFPFKFPVRVDINTGDVGGPSAGLAFALTIYQQLTHQDLTHGNRVAITGEIRYTAIQVGKAVKWVGLVEPIGGAKQKAIAAQAAGAKYFLVPSANYQDAKSADTSLVIKRVTTLEQAIAVLKSLPPSQTQAG